MSHGVTSHKHPLLHLRETETKHLSLFGKETARLQLAMQRSGYRTGELVEHSALETHQMTWFEQTPGPSWIGDGLWSSR